MHPAVSRSVVYPVIFRLRREAVQVDLSALREAQWQDTPLVEERQLQRFRRVAAAGMASFAFYRDMVAESGLSVSDLKSLDDVARWPLMDKSYLNQATRDLRRAGRPLGRHTVRMSGGSTGSPCVVLADRATSSQALATRALFQEWHGIGIGDRQVRLWGHPLAAGAWREHLKDWLLNRLRLDSLALGEDRFAETLARVSRFGAEYVYGYASLVTLFVDRLRDADVVALRRRLKAAITTSETISQTQRQKLQARLGVPVIDEYGCSEVDIISYCCPAGGRHTAAESVLVEVVRDGDEPEGFGRVVVTDLNNTLMPVVRYRVGDLAPLARPRCDCGRSWACLGPVLGRVQNQFIAIDGGRAQVHSQFVVYLIERLFDEGWGIGRFQIVQEAPDLLVLRIVRAGGVAVDTGILLHQLAREGRAVLGAGMRWRVETVPASRLETSASHKFQHFVSRITPGPDPQPTEPCRRPRRV